MYVEDGSNIFIWKWHLIQFCSFWGYKFCNLVHISFYCIYMADKRHLVHCCECWKPWLIPHQPLTWFSLLGYDFSCCSMERETTLHGVRNSPPCQEDAHPVALPWTPKWGRASCPAASSGVPPAVLHPSRCDGSWGGAGASFWYCGCCGYFGRIIACHEAGLTASPGTAVCSFLVWPPGHCLHWIQPLWTLWWPPGWGCGWDTVMASRPGCSLPYTLQGSAIHRLRPELPPFLINLQTHYYCSYSVWPDASVYPGYKWDNKTSALPASSFFPV